MIPLAPAARVLPPPHFQRPALEVAPSLIGLWLTVSDGKTTRAHQITEVEAYLGPEDLASHARFESSRRNHLMFGPGGVWYVYLIYGIHTMLNLVAGSEHEPGAVLIRGVTSLPGPGRVTKALGITLQHNGLPATRASGLYLEQRGEPIPDDDIASSPRIGVDYAGPDWSLRPYRFYWTRHVKK